MSDISSLQRTINLAQKALNINISYWPFGMQTILGYDMEIDFKNIMHSCEYCKLVKSLPKGQSLCYKNKFLGQKKSCKTTDGYYGMCYMGVCDLVKPVIVNDKIKGVLYFTGFRYFGDSDRAELMIKKFSKRIHLDYVKALQEYNKLKVIDDDEMQILSDCADELKEIITLKYLANPNFLKADEVIINKKDVKKKWLAQYVIPYINENYLSNLTLEQIAKMFYVNHQYLCRAIKSETGQNFKDYVNNLRIEKAKKLLTETDQTITNIALSVGYNDSNYFSRVFKGVVKLTPTEYKERNRN